MVPEMPMAMYSCGETVLPVWPTWNWCGYQPASVTAREAPTAAPMASASRSMIAKPSGLPVPRPPETTIEASVRSGRSPCSATTRAVIFAPVGRGGQGRPGPARPAGRPAGDRVRAHRHDGSAALDPGVHHGGAAEDLLLGDRVPVLARDQVRRVGHQPGVGLDRQPGGDLLALRRPGDQHQGRGGVAENRCRWLPLSR